jgi:hypothetical protein
LTKFESVHVTASNPLPTGSDAVSSIVPVESAAALNAAFAGYACWSMEHSAERDGEAENFTPETEILLMLRPV